MRDVFRDLRYAARSLRKARGFTLIAVITLALGVGANTAVFSLISAVLLRPLPYQEPDRLVLIWESAPFFGLRDSPVAPANYFDWRSRGRSFEEMGALEDKSYRLIGDGIPEVIDGSLVTASILRVLRVQPMMGRLFHDSEDRPGAAKVAIVSEGFWRRRFASNPNIVGQTVRLNEEQHTIVGVLASGTEPPAEYRSRLGEVWTPLGSAYSEKELANRGRHNWMVAARLRPSVTLRQADAEMRMIGANLAREYPGTNEKVGAFVAPLREHFVSSTRQELFILLGTVLLVLLIACSNLANLMLFRAAQRGKEAALRAALGAGAWGLFRQSLCESLLLCGAGSAAGAILATTTFEFLARLAPATMTGLNALTLDWRVLSFTLAIAVLTTIALGLAPMLQIRRLDLNHALKQSARTLAAASGSRRLRAALICAQVALAFVLLIGAGLLIQTLARLRGVNVGFRTGHLLTLNLPALTTHRGPGQIAAYQREILRRVREAPGVASAGFTNHIPLVVKGDITGIGAEGHDAKVRFQCNSRVAGPGYFQTMGIPLRQGRDITEADGEGAPLVVLINETLARTLWPNQDPIGRRLIFGTGIEVPVIGVVADIHQSGLNVPPKPEFYVSALQAGFPPSALAIRTKVEPASLAPAIRQAIWSVDRDQPITQVATMEQILDQEVFQRQIQTALLSVFAGLALVLAAVGLYGVLAYIVGQRIPEIGVRIALGAEPGDVLRSIIGQGLGIALVGAAIGWLGALMVTRLLGSILFNVKPADPATYAAATAVLVVVSALASYVPARRAMRVDPMVALREE